MPVDDIVVIVCFVIVLSSLRKYNNHVRGPKWLVLCICNLPNPMFVAKKLIFSFEIAVVPEHLSGPADSSSAFQVSFQTVNAAQSRAKNVSSISFLSLFI